jgi:hypothetical protein
MTASGLAILRRRSTATKFRASPVGTRQAGGVPGLKRISIEAAGDNRLTTFRARRISLSVRLNYFPVQPIYFPVRPVREFALGSGRISIT